jgi:hypothetical protein
LGIPIYTDGFEKLPRRCQLAIFAAIRRASPACTQGTALQTAKPFVVALDPLGELLQGGLAPALALSDDPDAEVGMEACASDDLRMRSLLPGIPLVESPFFQEIAKASSFDSETLRVAKALNEDGFAVFRFPDDKFEERARLAPRFDFSGWRAVGWKSGDGMRIGDAWRFDEDVRALAANARVLAVLSAIYGRSSKR